MDDEGAIHHFVCQTACLGGCRTGLCRQPSAPRGPPPCPQVGHLDVVHSGWPHFPLSGPRRVHVRGCQEAHPPGICFSHVRVACWNYRGADAYSVRGACNARRSCTSRLQRILQGSGPGRRFQWPQCAHHQAGGGANHHPSLAFAGGVCNTHWPFPAHWADECASQPYHEWLVTTPGAASGCFTACGCCCCSTG